MLTCQTEHALHSAQRNEARGARRGLRGFCRLRAATRPPRPSSACANARRGRLTVPRHKAPPTSAGIRPRPAPPPCLTTPATSSTCRRFPGSARVSIREHSQDVTNHQPSPTTTRSTTTCDGGAFNVARPGSKREAGTRESSSELLEAHRDAPEPLDALKEVFHEMPVFVEVRVVVALRVSWVDGDHHRAAASDESVDQRLCTVGAVRDDVSMVNIAEQFFGDPHLVSLAGGQNHPRRVTERVDYRVELRRWTAARAANRLFAAFWGRR